jgi:hypothetical protein
VTGIVPCIRTREPLRNFGPRKAFLDAQRKFLETKPKTGDPVLCIDVSPPTRSWCHYSEVIFSGPSRALLQAHPELQYTSRLKYPPRLMIPPTLPYLVQGYACTLDWCTIPEPHGLCIRNHRSENSVLGPDHILVHSPIHLA